MRDRSSLKLASPCCTTMPGSGREKQRERRSIISGGMVVGSAMAQKCIQAVEGTGLQGGCRGIGQTQSEVDKAAHEGGQRGMCRSRGLQESIQKWISNGGEDAAAECKCGQGKWTGVEREGAREDGTASTAGAEQSRAEQERDSSTSSSSSRCSRTGQDRTGQDRTGQDRRDMVGLVGRFGGPAAGGDLEHDPE